MNTQAPRPSKRKKKKRREGAKEIWQLARVTILFRRFQPEGG